MDFLDQEPKEEQPLLYHIYIVLTLTAIMVLYWVNPNWTHTGMYGVFISDSLPARLCRLSVCLSFNLSTCLFLSGKEVYFHIFFII